MKTTKQALKMAETIDKEANELPDENFFGDSNISEIEKSRAWAFALREYVVNGTIPEKDNDYLAEVRSWITGEEWSALKDYEGGE